MGSSNSMYEMPAFSNPLLVDDIWQALTGSSEREKF
jgi:hypothetical protein